MKGLKKFFAEFKEFALKGNVVSMAVGIIIGGAFQSIVTSLIDNVISPLVGCFNTGGMENLYIHVWNADLMIGAFLMDIINFIIMALVIFMIVKAMNKLMDMGHKKKEEDPTTKKCPYCQSEIDINAKKCPHCTSDLD